MRTKTGKLLTEEEIQALADEAERGYCVEEITVVRRCFHPLPCPDHDKE